MVSPSATKMSALPKALGSSDTAPIAAGTPLARARPPPIPARPVQSPAAIRPRPLLMLLQERALLHVCLEQMQKS